MTIPMSSPAPLSLHRHFNGLCTTPFHYWPAQTQASKLFILMECAVFDVLAYVSYPALRKIVMHSATALEHLNSEINPRTQRRHAPGAEIPVAGWKLRLLTFWSMTNIQVGSVAAIVAQGCSEPADRGRAQRSGGAVWHNFPASPCNGEQTSRLQVSRQVQAARRK